jgi:PAS domain S-box-containing protein
MNQKESGKNPFEQKLGEEIRNFYHRSPFRRYLLVFALVMLVLEIVFVGVFNFFISDRIETQRKKGFQTAWENYLVQKWKVDYSKITGFIWWGAAWNKVYNGRREEVVRSFLADPSLREDYEYFSIHLSPNEPLVQLNGRNFEPGTYQIEKSVLERLYRMQSEKAGTLHLILPLWNEELFLISVSALCDNVGKPIYPGIAIFGTPLPKFMQLAEEILPTSLALRKGDFVNGYLGFPIPDKLDLGKSYHILATPRHGVTQILFSVFLFFLTVQLVLSFILFIILAPKYTKERTANLEDLVSSSERLNFSLKEKIQELGHVNKLLEKSETKYKHLVESSKDIIFSFDKNGFILTANKTMENLLGIKSTSWIGKFFLDLSYNPERKIETLEKQILMEKFEELKENESSVSFEMIFETKNKEPLHLDVKWEYVPIGDSFVVFGKAFTFREDPMLKYFVSERKTYHLQNYITHADQISQRITNNLSKYFGAQDFFNIRLCIREIIINAIEHGNLEIDFATKTRAKEAKNYFQFLRERQNEPEFAKRKVKVHYSLTPEKVSYLIRDEGKGFDHKSFIHKHLERDDIIDIPHGRGILLTLHTFDIVRYNSKGNQVYLSKKVI